ncbi:hypothetical protein [Methylobacterium radiodurans]|uniref:Uncharacterized protein n=1 Tax=Methylobacterium radiodurans TaxID=2202828 RepID=A0A2U8VMX1_9HYPH|nr:hypothetical protein [Methylobacterium radiodurans]AWN35029.1 hypothetical protein DK427_04110 [Methylobacterium radiodurans]
MLRTLTLAATALACLLPARTALAADAAVILPWGDWLVALAQTLQAVLTPMLIGLVTGLIARLAPLLSYVVTRGMVEGMVARITDYALNAVAGAAKGRVLSVPVGSAVIAAAVQRAADEVPGFVIRAAGGLPGLAERVFRRLDLEADATAANTLAPALDAVGRRPRAR